MKAEGKALTFLSGMKILEVPFFQRKYVWKKDNWEELLEDLLEINKSHFLGSIILKSAEEREGKDKKFFIIDGQQRLTTLSILIKALYDCMENERDIIIDDAKAALFYKSKPLDSEYKISIKHSYNDAKQFEEVIGSVHDNFVITSSIMQEKANDEDSLIKKCYKYFYAELKKIYKATPDKIKNFWNFLFNPTNTILVVIELSATDEEQKIFDTINSAGIRLSGADVIKNMLYQHLMEILDDREYTTEYYKDTWEKIFEDVEMLEYWSREKTTGRLKSQNIEILLRSVAIIKNVFDPNKDAISTLPYLYKTYIKSNAYKANKPLNEDETKKLIEEIIDYAILYKTHIPDFDGSELFTFDDVQMRLFKILDENDITSFNPYILYLLKKYKNNEDLLNKKLQILERFIVSSILTKKYMKDFSKLSYAAIQDDSIIQEKSKEITNEMLRESIKTGLSNKTGKMLLFWVELYRRNKVQAEVQALQYSFQLEHIMPKKWTEHWKEVPFVDENQNVIENKVEGAKIRTKKITSIGNMTLLMGKLNPLIANHIFKLKMEGLGRKHGIIKNSPLLITQDDVVKTVYNNKNNWNEAEIYKREKILFSDIIDIWGSK